MSRWLVHMGHHRFVVEGETREDADRALDERLTANGLERDEAKFHELEDHQEGASR